MTEPTTLKKQLLQELEQIPDDALAQILVYVRSLKSSLKSTEDSQVWQAYLASEREREEVYRRLANS